MWGIFSWFSSVLRKWGLFEEKRNLLIIGLDNAGKSTLLHRLVHGDIPAPPPTPHPDKQEISLHGIRLSAYDIGGHFHMRRLWKDFLFSTNAIIFIVDASDTERIPEACEELEKIMSDSCIDEVIPIAVLFNKLDIPHVRPPQELTNDMKLLPYLTGKGKVSKEMLGNRRPVEVFMCSVLQSAGYATAFEWLTQYL